MHIRLTTKLVGYCKAAPNSLVTIESAALESNEGIQVAGCLCLKISKEITPNVSLEKQNDLPEETPVHQREPEHRLI